MPISIEIINKYLIFYLFLKEDAYEKFEKMQREIMSDDMDSIPFNTARMRADKRVNNFFYFIIIFNNY